MKYNDAITSEYGKFPEIAGTSPVPYKPLPSKNDYEREVFARVFVKKYNEDIIVEISPEKVSKINTSLYEIININWRISGSRNSKYDKNNVITVGVFDQNSFEISKILTEKNVDLKKVLPNLLEYWQGH